MNFYTVILRKSADYWVSLCLENGLVGQGETQEKANQANIYTSPIPIDELHEFLTVGDSETPETYELRKVYA